MLESTEKGGVRNSIHNCLTVFQHDPELSGAVAKNLLTERIDLLKPIGRKRRTGSKAMTDTDMKYIRLYLEKTYGLTSEKKIADAADLAADANSYHPIRDYLNGLVWDGKERIRYCLRHFLGADTDNFTYHSLRLFLLGAIHRAFCPGCKFEVMLCLVGGQGAGKSTFFRLLAVKDEWFSDDLRKLDDDTADVKGVLAEFGPERVSYVLAATLQDKTWDQRFSRSNQAWAAAIPMFETEDRRLAYLINSHPTLLDGFVNMVRKELDAMREQPEQKPSIKAQLAAKPVPGDQPATKPKDREVR